MKGSAKRKMLVHSLTDTRSNTLIIRTGMVIMRHQDERASRRLIVLNENAHGGSHVNIRSSIVFLPPAANLFPIFELK